MNNFSQPRPSHFRCSGRSSFCETCTSPLTVSGIGSRREWFVDRDLRCSAVEHDVQVVLPLRALFPLAADDRRRADVRYVVYFTFATVVNFFSESDRLMASRVSTIRGPVRSIGGISACDPVRKLFDLRRYGVGGSNWNLVGRIEIVLD